MNLGFTRPRSFGFHSPEPETLLRYPGEAPVTVIAPTGSGKGVSFVIPSILAHPGPLIALDVKGELTAICARRRREMGKVYVLDPFDVAGGSDRLNPFDLIKDDDDAEMVASMLSSGHEFSSDAYWTDTANGLMAGVVSGLSIDPKKSMRKARDLLMIDDTDYNLALWLDRKPEGFPDFAYRELSSYLQINSDKTRPCVLSTAKSYLRSLNSEKVVRCLEDSTIPLQDVIEGKPLSIFLCIPPDKLKSHKGLLRLWMGTLLGAVMKRKTIPKRRTLFCVDEAASLGQFDPLLTAITLLRGYGVQVLSVWQDIAQIKSCYPKDYQTILNNCGAVMAFGFPHFSAAKDASEVFGVAPGELLELERDEAVVSVSGKGVQRIRRLDYMRDRMFTGMFDENPFHKQGLER